MTTESWKFGTYDLKDNFIGEETDFSEVLFLQIQTALSQFSWK